MAYAEKYEGRTVLDSWREGDGGDIAVVTVDRDREAWCHIVDPDGIERSRRAGNDTAAAAQYRERGGPEADPPVIPDPAPPAPDTANAVAVAANPAAGESAAADYPVAADSLLTQVRAYALVTARLRAAAEACGAGLRDDPAVPRAAVEPLTGLREPLLQLHARFSAGSVQQLIQRAEAGTLTRHAFAVALEDLVTRLRDELALTRIVLMPSGARPEPGEAPFGGRVETRFPEAAYDIEEAVHCLALRRATAAVLHAMQVMRHGLRAASGLLDTPPLTALSWSALIETVRAAGADREMVEALHRVRRLLHRPDLTPGGKYTEAEAEAVLEAVASFMRCLAGAMDARGVPVGD